MSIPDYPMAWPPGFAACSIDRQGHIRTDPDTLRARSGDAAVVLVHRYKLPVRGDRAELVPAGDRDLSQAVYLGEWDGQDIYALDVSAEDPEQLPGLRFAELRGAAMRLAPDHAAVLAYARAMLYWHRQHRHCGRCGGPTEMQQAGHTRYCPACECEHYPRTDPSMLVLVTTPDDRGLLGRQPGWPQGMWSVLAGFVEPGESIEDAVVREVWEEARIRVDGMRYLTSQPWPFPASVLMGFRARAPADPPQVEQDELEACHWYSRDQLASALRAREVFLPPPFTLSYRLIEDWFDEAFDTRLAELTWMPGAP